MAANRFSAREWGHYRHCRQRAQERFGLALTKPQYRQLTGRIWRGQVDPVPAPRGAPGSRWAVELEGTPMVAVFRNGLVVTLLLPAQAAGG